MFIRHGERCDNSKLIEEQNRVTTECDPPLTKLGLSQAHMCGKYLRKHLERGNYDHIIIESSPFLRCMETSAAIAKELGKSKVKVNYRWSEWLKEKFFPKGSPVEDLIINNTEESEFSQKWMQGLKFNNDKDFVRELAILWPERYNDCARRAARYGSDLHERYKKVNEKTVHLVISHGINVKAYAEMALSEDDSHGRPKVRIVNVVDYTGIAAATIRGASVRLSHGGNSDHLNDKAAEKHMEENNEKEDKTHQSVKEKEEKQS